MLRRAHQPFTAEMLKYRNAAPAKVIVVYDLAGSTAAAEGNLFVEKGIDNLIVLSGGEQKSKQNACCVRRAGTSCVPSETCPDAENPLVQAFKRCSPTAHPSSRGPRSLIPPLQSRSEGGLAAVALWQATPQADLLPAISAGQAQVTAQ